MRRGKKERKRKWRVRNIEEGEKEKREGQSGERRGKKK